MNEFIRILCIPFIYYEKGFRWLVRWVGLADQPVRARKTPSGPAPGGSTSSAAPGQKRRKISPIAFSAKPVQISMFWLFSGGSESTLRATYTPYEAFFCV